MEHDDFSSPLDPGVAPYVRVLRENGVETFESCEGGPGHAYTGPSVRFHGGVGEGHRALGVAIQNALPVAELRRVWSIEDGEPVGPYWELRFTRTAETKKPPVAA